MRFGAILMKKILIMIFLFPALLCANNLEPHKKTCSDIGFTSGTEEYAQCVMDFFKKEKDLSSVFFILCKTLNWLLALIKKLLGFLISPG